VQVLHPPQQFENPTIAIFKSSFKENNYLNNTCRYVHDLSFYQTLFKCNGSCVVSMKQHVNLSLNRPPYSYFPFLFDKNGLIKSCSSSELSEYSISWSCVDWYKYLSSLNVRHLGMVVATALKSMASRSPSMTWPPY
jgi:hypothetical protein